MKKLILLLTIALIMIPATLQAAGSTDALKKTADKIRQAKSLEIEYLLTSDGQSMRGHLTLSGDRFVLSSNQLTSWYDGKTQWTYSTYMGEVNVTEPTAEELAQVNPFSIIKSFTKDYTVSPLSETKGCSVIQLKSKSKPSDISSAIFTINNATSFPSEIKLTMSGGRIVTIKIISIREGGAKPESDFRFDPKDYPTLQVVDLR